MAISVLRSTGRQPRKRVLVAESHSQSREAICSTIRAEPSLELAGCAPDAAAVISRAGEFAPDVLVIDSDLLLGALAAAHEIRSRMPTVHLVIVNGPEEGDFLEALASGSKRVAVYDFDVHHGNGTEDILLDKPGAAFFSIHQFPCYPGTGSANAGALIGIVAPVSAVAGAKPSSL